MFEPQGAHLARGLLRRAEPEAHRGGEVTALRKPQRREHGAPSVASPDLDASQLGCSASTDNLARSNGFQCIGHGFISSACVCDPAGHGVANLQPGEARPGFAQLELDEAADDVRKRRPELGDRCDEGSEHEGPRAHHKAVERRHVSTICST